MKRFQRRTKTWNVTGRTISISHSSRPIRSVAATAPLAAHHCPVANHCALRCLAELRPKPVGSNAEQLCRTRKAFSAVLCSSFTVKMSSSSSKTAAAATLISPAAVIVMVRYIMASWSSPRVSESSVKQPLLALIPPASLKSWLVMESTYNFKTNPKHFPIGDWQDGRARFQNWNPSSPATVRG